LEQTANMNLSETELKIGNTSFKGVYIAILLSLATSLGGMVWGASALYARLESVESRSIPDIQPITEEVQLIKQQLSDNDIKSLSAKLATLGTNIATIMETQQKLLELQSDVDKMRTSVTQAELITKEIGDVDERIKMIDTDINQLWEALDYMSSNPLN
jgi:predicted RNase H-like nuclease (RuvC/YqgF family)